MKFNRRLLMLLMIAVVIIPACSKNADPIPPAEEVVDEDTISFPHIMFASEKKGAARLFTNGKEIFDSAYASEFVAEAARYYFDYAEPPRKLQFESKDTVGIFFTNSPAKYGIRKEGNIDYLYDRYPMALLSEEDTNMVAYTINAQTGLPHQVLTGYGDYKEYKIPAFSYVRSTYRIDRNDSTKTYLSVRKMSYRYNDFKESYVNTLGQLDTFAIQEYEMVFKKM